jgi:hypothetical protein
LLKHLAGAPNGFRFYGTADVAKATGVVLTFKRQLLDNRHLSKENLDENSGNDRKVSFGTDVYGLRPEWISAFYSAAAAGRADGVAVHDDAGTDALSGSGVSDPVCGRAAFTE